MNDDERRLHDWLDEELDRMAIGGDRPVDPRRVFASETDRALYETAADLRRLDAAQASEPSAGFLNHLENQLMSSKAASRSWSDPVNAKHTETIGAPGQYFRPQPRPTLSMKLSNFVTFALVLALMVASASAFFILRDNGAPGSESPNYAATTGSPATPVGEPQHREELAIEPNANWTWAFPDGTLSAEYGEVLVRNGHAYRQLMYDGASESIYFNGIQAIDTATGEISWEYRTPWIYRTFAADDVGVYTATVPNTVVALDPATGDERWSNSFSGSVISLAVNEGRVFIWTSTHELNAFDASSGSVLWSTAVESSANFEFAGNGMAIIASAIRATPDGVTAMTADGTIVAFDSTTGEQRWAQPGFDVKRTDTVVTGDTVLAMVTPETDDMTYEEIVVREGTAFSLTSGEMIWQISVTGPNIPAVAPGATGMFNFIGNDVQTIVSPVDSATPEIDFETDGSNDLLADLETDNIWGTAEADVEDDVIHTDPETGQTFWSGDVPSGADFVFGIDAATGQISWKRSAVGIGFAGLITSYASPDIVWALTYGNQVVPLQGESGQVLAEPITIENALRGVAIGTVEEGWVVQLYGGVLIGFGQVSDGQQD